MKDIKDIVFITNARLDSQRIPQKMIKPFADTTLMDICIKKLKNSRIVPKENIFMSDGLIENSDKFDNKALYTIVREHEINKIIGIDIIPKKSKDVTFINVIASLTFFEVISLSPVPKE